VFEHDAVVGGLHVRVHDIDVFVVNFCILHHDDDGGEGVVDTAPVAEAILLVIEDAVGFYVFRACIFDYCSLEFDEVVR
jgi:hypothetical protein